MAGKRVSLASLAASKVEAVPGASRPDLLHVHPDTVAPTPLNPRRDFDKGELTELGEDMRGGQLQPCVAVAKSSYLKLYPEHADQLPEGCRYVMAAGERRWRAALMVGLDTLDVLLRHDLTESRIRFFAAVLSENVQRANFNPIEEANGLRAMLDLHDGNQSAAAKAMGKSKQWFSQRIGLLRLTDEMVQLVLEGKLTAFREMRRYAAMPAEEQYPAWKADQEQPRPPKPPVQEPVQAPEAYTAVYAGPAERVPGPADPVSPADSAAQAYTAVYPPAGPPAEALPADGPVGEAEPEVYTAVYAPTDSPAADRAVETSAARPDGIPEPRESSPRPEGTDHAALKMFPYDDGTEAGNLLLFKMPPEERDKVCDMLLRDREKRAANAS